MKRRSILMDHYERCDTPGKLIGALAAVLLMLFLPGVTAAIVAIAAAIRLFDASGVAALTGSVALCVILIPTGLGIGFFAVAAGIEWLAEPLREYRQSREARRTDAPLKTHP